jgi:F-type H+-transporting ATPase subunit delta
MIPGTLARRYARALLDLAASPIQRDKFAKDLDSIADLAKQRDTAGTEVLAVLSAERFAVSERKNLLGALATRINADPTVVRFLELVIERGRMHGLHDIVRAYRRLADQAAGRMRAHITSATLLTESHTEQIKAALERATGKTIIATTSVDPDLIGGIVARVGSYLIDGSVRSTLNQLRTSLRST